MQNLFNFGFMNCFVSCEIFNIDNKIIMDAALHLPSDALKNLYAGEKFGRILVLNFKRISPKLFRFQVRDLIHRDDYLCQKEEYMSGMIPGDLIEVEDSVCIKVPEIRRTVVLLGPVKIVARWKDVSWSHLSDTIPLPSHHTSIN